MENEGLEMTSGADVMARYLHAAGCRHAFGMPGGEVLSLIDALDRAGVSFVLTKHETAAGFMAEGIWHARRVPGVLVATLGPGVTNAINAVANALQDRVPLIFVTGRIDLEDEATFTHQVIDHQALLRPIVKASFRATTGSIAVMMARALALACDGQPGPVHIDVPVSVAAASEPLNGVTLAPRRAPAAPAPGAELEAARSHLRGARRALVVAGVDAVNQDAGAAVADFCRRFALPLLTTYKAKGIMPEDEPLAIGGFGLSPKADAVVLPLVLEADVVVLAGYDPIEMRIGWRHPFASHTRVLGFAAAAPEHGMHRLDHLFVGDIAAGLAALAGGVEETGRWPSGRIETVQQALRQAFQPESGWGPGVVFDTLQAMAPPGRVLTADSGAHRILLSQMWRAKRPGELLQSSGFCTMGCALPIAMGVGLARPGPPVIAVMGDAGLAMVMGELTTLRDLKLPVIIVILVDQRLALIDLKQRAMNHGQVGVAFGPTDFPALAMALGGHGDWADDRVSFERALESALARHTTFSLIACRIDADAYRGRI
jgi:acetolactate synthase-1/2/3 large subunit